MNSKTRRGVRASVRRAPDLAGAADKAPIPRGEIRPFPGPARQQARIGRRRAGAASSGREMEKLGACVRRT